MYVYQLTKQKHAWMHRIRRLGHLSLLWGSGRKGYGVWLLSYTMAWELGGVEVMFSTQWRFLFFLHFVVLVEDCWVGGVLYDYHLGKLNEEWREDCLGGILLLLQDFVYRTCDIVCLTVLAHSLLSCLRLRPLERSRKAPDLTRISEQPL